MQGGMPVLADGYPVISQLGPRRPNPRWFMPSFARKACSTPARSARSGALGLMQLMPATQSVAGKLKIKRFNTTALTNDPRTNVTLGANYLDGLVDRFNGSYVMAIAGYNAGPGRVSGWLGENGDPRPKLEDTIDWIRRSASAKPVTMFSA